MNVWYTDIHVYIIRKKNGYNKIYKWTKGKEKDDMNARVKTLILYFVKFHIIILYKFIKLRNLFTVDILINVKNM